MDDRAAADTPRLSIVIPARDAATTLAQQLDAVLSSAAADMEVIVVDNGSTDGTQSIAERYARSDDRVRLVVATELATASYARMAGVRAARSECLGFCDADDVVAPTWAPAIASALSSAEFVTGPVELDLLNAEWLAGFRGRAVYEQLPRSADGGAFAHGCNMGIRRSLLDRVGGFDVTMKVIEDIDFAMRASAAGAELVWVPEAVVHYRHRASGVARWRQGIAYGRAAHHLRVVHGRRWPLSARVRSQARRLAWLAKTTPRLGSREIRARWTWTLARSLGEMLGSKG